MTTDEERQEAIRLIDDTVRLPVDELIRVVDALIAKGWGKVPDLARIEEEAWLLGVRWHVEHGPQLRQVGWWSERLRSFNQPHEVDPSAPGYSGDHVPVFVQEASE